MASKEKAMFNLIDWELENVNNVHSSLIARLIKTPVPFQESHKLLLLVPFESLKSGHLGTGD